MTALRLLGCENATLLIGSLNVLCNTRSAKALSRHDTQYNSPVPKAQQIRNTFGTTIIAIGVPGLNGFLKPVDIEVSCVNNIPRSYYIELH